MTQTLHYSEGKSGVDQIPPDFLLELGQIYSYGAKKYARDNWKNGTDWHQFYGSLLRHALKFWNGQEYDLCDEQCEHKDADFCPNHSRRHHLAQVAWNAATLFYYEQHNKGEDSRDIYSG